MNLESLANFFARVKPVPLMVMCLVLASGIRLKAAQLPPSQIGSDEHKSWKQYGGGPDQSKYMDLTEITKDNVNRLQVIWDYTNGERGVFFNPIVVDGVMYVLVKNNSLVALNATNGTQIWIHPAIKGIIRTGINYWASQDKKDRRLIFCANETLQALDAATGLSITNFGNNGSTSLKEGLARDPASIGREQGTAPGQIYDNLIFLGSSPGEEYFSAPGHLRAYDVVTGKLVWVFHTIPLPGEYGYDTWPTNAYKYAGGVNTWGEITVDQKNGIAFFPLGAPTYDYFGADRIGNDLYDECILALDARTGRHLWHFQTVHHGLWDYDLCSAAQLITVHHDGKIVEAVAVAGKNGFLYVFNRLTGEPLWPIVERPVPPSDVPQELASPTQPFPTVVPPFTRQNVTTNDLNPYFSPEKRAEWIKRIAAARTGLFQPLSDKYEVISMPGAVGGANRGCTAADPEKGIVYVISAEYPSVYRLKREAPVASAATNTNSNRTTFETAVVSEDPAVRGKSAYVQSCQGCHGIDRTGLASVVPSLVNVSARVNFEDFKTQVGVGKGRMPGFPRIDDRTVADLYAYLGGVPGEIEAKPEMEAGHDPKQIQHKKHDFNRSGMRGYPPGVTGPTNNFTTDFGMDNPDLLSPPWSTITAYDLNKGTIKWRSPLGQDPKIVPKDGKPTGFPNGSERRGMIVTSTGLVFSTCGDGRLYAYDADNGNVLWSTQLPRNTEGLPAMYEVNGRAYIAICTLSSAGDESKPASPPGYVVYGLPDGK